MSKLEVTTTTGSVYFIDTEAEVWAKNDSFWNRLTRLSVGEWDGTRSNVPDTSEWPEVEIPQVGKNMYIQGKGLYDWWLTTPIVSVDEVEGDEWPWV